MKRALFFASLLIFSFTWTAECMDNWEMQIYDLIDSGKARDAIPMLEQWKEINGEDDPQYWIAGANIWLRLAVNPQIPIALVPHGTAARKQGDLMIVGVPDGLPLDYDPREYLQLDPNNFRKAIEFMETGALRHPYRLDLFAGRAFLYRFTEDTDAEVSALKSMVIDAKAKNGRFETIPPKRFIDGPPEAYQLEILMGFFRQHVQNEEDEAAGKIARLVIEIFPKRPHGYNAMAALESFKENWPEVKKWLEQALQQDPKDSLVIKNLGLCYERLENMDLAIEQYEKVVQLNNDPEFVEFAQTKLKKLRPKSDDNSN